MMPTKVKFRPLVLAGGFVLCLAPASQAAHGVVDLSWGTCSPVVNSIVDPGNGPLSLIVSQLGNDRSHMAYQVRFQLGGVDDVVPDAWRFDASGCGASRISFHSSPPTSLAKTCPAFQGGSPMVLTNFAPFPEGSSYAQTLMRGVLVNAYGAVRAQPTQRSFLAEFVFDHAFSVEGPTTPGVNCGGLEEPIVIKLLFDTAGNERTSYLEDNGLEYTFEPGNTTVTVNGSGVEVPVASSTWGQVKSIYRR